MRYIALLLLINLSSMSTFAQAPDKIYGQLYTDVEMQHVFPDSKTFADCVPKGSPEDIVAAYQKEKATPGFSLKQFVAEHFTAPVSPTSNYHSDKNGPVADHIRQLWTVLSRAQDKDVPGSSLLPLPHPYIVPGGRFQEIYYWDSFFTMLGLQESGRYDMITNMVDNFAYMISHYGHIPNGNRTYYLSRSQPPYFSLMVDLLAEKNGDSVYAHYQKALEQEYDYWMDRTAPTKHVVRMPDGSQLTRYYDQDNIPRQESYYEDSVLVRDVRNAASDASAAPTLYRELRTCAETGWDFSSRWLGDGEHLSTIRTTDLVPVDLNSLMYNLELSLGRACLQTGDTTGSRTYFEAAGARGKAINKYCWSADDDWYYDYDITTGALSKEKTIAGMTPFLFRIAPVANISAADVLEKEFLKPGGVVTTLKNTGQQWDAPNGWAPLQWITIRGLENYGRHDLAKKIAVRWVDLNTKVFHATGKLMEKYDVTDLHLSGGGGEYPSQDGFGWTNGVLLKLMHLYNIK